MSTGGVGGWAVGFHWQVSFECFWGDSEEWAVFVCIISLCGLGTETNLQIYIYNAGSSSQDYALLEPILLCAGDEREALVTKL